MHNMRCTVIKGKLDVTRLNYVTVLMCCTALFLAACGGTTTVIDTGPTQTPDPLAFFAPTPISPGQPDNPLEILYVPYDPTSALIDTSAQSAGRTATG